MTDKLTAKQKKFVANVTHGMSATKAAELAGYSDPSHDCYRLRQTPSVQKALYNAQISALTQELLPKSFQRLSELLDDLSPAPSGIKLKAATYVIDKAIELQNMANAADIAQKNPLDLTTAELEIFVMRGRMVLKKERAKAELGIIDIEPGSENDFP